MSMPPFFSSIFSKIRICIIYMTVKSFAMHGNFKARLKIFVICD